MLTMRFSSCYQGILCVRSHLLTRKSYLLTCDESDGSKKQIVYYQSGVASFADFEGNLNTFNTILRK